MTRSILSVLGGLGTLALSALGGCYADVGPYAAGPVYAPAPVYATSYAAQPVYTTSYAAPRYRPAPRYYAPAAPYRTVVVAPRHRRYW